MPIHVVGETESAASRDALSPAVVAMNPANAFTGFPVGRPEESTTWATNVSSQSRRAHDYGNRSDLEAEEHRGPTSTTDAEQYPLCIDTLSTALRSASIPSGWTNPLPWPASFEALISPTPTEAPEN